MPVAAARRAASNADEDPAFLSRQLITCIGNKRALLADIAVAVEQVCRRLGRRKLRVLDAFAGSGVVSRFFKAHASCLVSNDVEDFAAAAARSHLRNRSAAHLPRLDALAARLNREIDRADLPRGFIESLYAPRRLDRIRPGERVFYTPENARRLDNYRRMLAALPADDRDLLMGPLLSAASIHANTAGVFKGFYKNRATRVGCFGGTHRDALSRITRPIVLAAPLLSRFECDVETAQEDANALVRRLPNLDLAYFDPPYNQHPYGSNYFMLNLLVHYVRPRRISAVSGIPRDWRRSSYNARSKALETFRDLLGHVDARFILVSFNDEGFIRPDQMQALLEKRGRVRRVEIKYNAFRGSRNLARREKHVTEQLFLTECR